MATSIVDVSQSFQWERASWQEACAIVKQFEDRLGTPIDDGIFETVVVLNLLGFRTHQSCEGHLDHGCPYPWITVMDQERSRRYSQERNKLSKLETQMQLRGTEEAFFQYIAAETTLRIEKHQWVWEDELHCRVKNLLNAFYTSQDKAWQHSPTRLYGNLQTPGICRIEPGSALHTHQMSDSLKASYLARSQAEMQTFTCFLKRRWQEHRRDQIIEKKTNCDLAAREEPCE